MGGTPLCTPPSNTPEGFAKTSQCRVRQGAGAQPDVQAACACVFGGVAVTTAAGAAQGSPREPWLGIRGPGRLPLPPWPDAQLSAPEERPRPHPGWWRSPRGPRRPSPRRHWDAADSRLSPRSSGRSAVGFRADKRPSPGTWPELPPGGAPEGPAPRACHCTRGKRAHKPKELARVSQRAVSGPGSGAGEGRCPLGGTGTSGGCFPAPLSAAPACPPFSHRKLSPDPTLHRCPQRRPIRAGHGHRPRKPFPRPTC